MDTRPPSGVANAKKRDARIGEIKKYFESGMEKEIKDQFENGNFAVIRKIGGPQTDTRSSQRCGKCEENAIARTEEDEEVQGLFEH
jgi:hypothetical protein